MAYHRIYFVCLVSLLLVVLGCKKAPAELKLSPVTGKILVNGKPVFGARLNFRPSTPLQDGKGRSMSPTAMTEKDGTFKPSTYIAGDGLPPGEYAVTVTWPKVFVDQGEEIFGEDQLKGVYANPDKPAKKIIIADGPNELPPIDLKM